jgi:glycosyltransferase involved in cell wall biosynthesis
MTMHPPLVTILINNFNYGRFLRQAIDSAIDQTYKNIEIVVVDDGSTDDSREIIASYGSRVVPILKENGGQASAFNAGIAASRGEIVCILDSDDTFYPEKVERVLEAADPDSVLYHRLQVDPGPGLMPKDAIQIMPDAYEYARRYRFVPYMGAPSSGIVLGRNLALRLFPIPPVRSSADDFVVRGASLIGHVKAIPDVLGAYRVHGGNVWYSTKASKSEAFSRDLQDYLNQKLVENGKEPVIDFFRSIYARNVVPQDGASLARLALGAFRHHPDRVTLAFMVKTMAIAGWRTLASNK